MTCSRTLFDGQGIRTVASRNPDPLGDRKEQLERRMARKMARFLRDQRERAIDVITESNFRPEPPRGQFWQKETDELKKLLEVELTAIAAEFGEVELIEIFRRRQLDQLGPEQIITEARLWAVKTASVLSREMVLTSQKSLAALLEQFFNTPGFTIGDLIDEIKKSPITSRAEATAVTEVTRASAQGQQITADLIRETGFNVVDVWNTNNDGLVCPICAPRHRTVRGEAWDAIPPAHVNCRCWITSRLAGVQVAEQPVAQSVQLAAQEAIGA